MILQTSVPMAGSFHVHHNYVKYCPLPEVNYIVTLSNLKNKKERKNISIMTANHLTMAVVTITEIRIIYRVSGWKISKIK
jgi:predicted RNA-binding protein with PUA-like domain